MDDEVEPEVEASRVVVATFLHGYEALLAQGRLEAEGIAAEVRDEGLVGANWLLSDAVGGVKVCVDEADATRALEVIARFTAHDAERDESFAEAVTAGEPAETEPAPAEAETSAQDRCPFCGSPRVRFEKLSRRRAGWSLLLHIPIPVQRNRYYCEACGEIWKRPGPPLP